MSRLLSLVVLVAIVAGAFYWWRTGSEAAEDMAVGVGKPVCEGTRVEGARTVVVSRRMQCTYLVTISNRTGREVLLNEIEADGLADGDRPVVQDGTRDAQRRLGTRLDPGESIERDFVVEFRQGGTSPRGRLRVDAPQVRASVWARPFTAAPDDPLVFLVPPGLAGGS